jgi:hypothetical protein
MRRFTRLGAYGFLILAAFGMTLMGVGGVRADFVKVDDRGDGIPNITTDNPAALVVDIRANEFLQFHFIESVAAGSDGIFFSDILSADGSLSDRMIFFQQLNSTRLDVVFASDGAANFPPVPPGAINLGTITENGNDQLIATYFNPGHPNTDYFMASDANEQPPDVVPEPSTLTLLGLGAFYLLGYRRRRLKRVAA